MTGFSLPQSVQTASVVPPVSYSMGRGDFYPGIVKRPRREADNFFTVPSLRMHGALPPLPPYDFMGCTMTNLLCFTLIKSVYFRPMCNSDLRYGLEIGTARNILSYIPWVTRKEAIKYEGICVGYRAMGVLRVMEAVKF